jgi:sugar transferase EpsL
MVKRIFDITVSLNLLIILLPFILLILPYFYFSMGKPFLFRQIRAGLNGQPFVMYKFRTMSHKIDVKGNLLPDNERLTNFGIFLRETSLDEIPQLVNVIIGDMSLVGPRPLLMEYLPLYSSEQAKRHLVKPGISGWAQVCGRNSLSWQEKFILDVWYVENSSFKLDIKILLLTIKKVLSKKHINASDTTTMKKFTGNL